MSGCSVIDRNADRLLTPRRGSPALRAGALRQSRAREAEFDVGSGRRAVRRGVHTGGGGARHRLDCVDRDRLPRERRPRAHRAGRRQSRLERAEVHARRRPRRAARVRARRRSAHRGGRHGDGHLRRTSRTACSTGSSERRARRTRRSPAPASGFRSRRRSSRRTAADISFRSVEGEGTTFTVDLPATA